MSIADLIKEEGASLVDVREVREFQSGHAPGAVNIPLSLLPLRLPELKEMSKPLILYCRSGGRSGQATAFLLREGFTNIHNAGGLEQVMRSIAPNIA